MTALSSVAAPQLSLALSAVTSVYDRVPGPVGGLVSELGRVVQSTAGLAREALPAASRAMTVRL